VFVYVRPVRKRNGRGGYQDTGPDISGRACTSTLTGYHRWYHDWKAGRCSCVDPNQQVPNSPEPLDTPQRLSRLYLLLNFFHNTSLGTIWELSRCTSVCLCIHSETQWQVVSRLVGRRMRLFVHFHSLHRKQYMICTSVQPMEADKLDTRQGRFVVCTFEGIDRLCVSYKMKTPHILWPCVAFPEVGQGTARTWTLQSKMRQSDTKWYHPNTYQMKTPHILRPCVACLKLAKVRPGPGLFKTNRESQTPSGTTQTALSCPMDLRADVPLKTAVGSFQPARLIRQYTC
jgi:hypothetical protein